MKETQYKIEPVVENNRCVYYVFRNGVLRASYCNRNHARNFIRRDRRFWKRIKNELSEEDKI